MTWRGSQSIEQLNDALESGNDRRTRRLVDFCLIAVQENPNEENLRAIGNVVSLLRKYVKPELLVQVAESIHQFAPANSKLLRVKYPQALIDSGEITKAIAFLKQSERELSADDERADLTETRGLLGRAYKQLYINAKPNPAEPRRYDLENAIRYYGETYREDKANYWHGINFVACKTHSSRIGSSASSLVPRATREVCAEIIRQANGDSAWEIATRAEAHLALGNYDEAVQRFHEYVEHPDTDRFKLNSTLRQMIELWNLDPETAPGDRVIPLLQARLLKIGRVNFPVGKSSATLDRLEKVFDSNTPYREIDWLKTALRRSQSVARLGPSLYEGDGTGFVVDGSEIGPAFKNRPLLMTNAHVCTDNDDLRMFLRRRHQINPLKPGETVVGFLGVDAHHGGHQPIRVKRVLYSSPPESFAEKSDNVSNSFDTSLLELEAIPVEAEPLSFSANRAPIQIDDRVNIIGYPRGRTLAVSIQDNLVVKTDQRHLWYRAPTDPGSSGSPVFDQDWNVVGLHHSSSAEHEANEGIRMEKIIADIRAKLIRTR